FLLGRYSSVASNFNYDKSGTAFPHGTGKNRDYNYNEFEFYAQDSWKVRSDLTLTLGLRWNFHTVPYEVNGFQSVPSVNENTDFAARLASAASGTSGIAAVPLVSYSLGGAANNKPGYYNPDHKDFGPRLGVAYNPSARNGLLGSILGERKTTIRLGGAILYDRIAGGASFGLDQNTFLFDSSTNNPFSSWRAIRDLQAITRSRRADFSSHHRVSRPPSRQTLIRPDSRSAWLMEVSPLSSSLTEIQGRLTPSSSISVSR